MVRRVLPVSLEDRCLVDWLFRGHGEGFYVYAKRGCLSLGILLVILVVICVIRLLLCLCISDFNVGTNVVTYWFVDENKVKQFVTLHVFEFIDRLVRLIADKNLKLICYYGLYSGRTTGKFQKVLTVFSCEKVPVKSKRVVVCCSNCGMLWILLVCLGLMKGVVWFMLKGILMIMQIGSVYLIRAEGALFFRLIICHLIRLNFL
jgi:hypothetical protein